MCRSLRLRGPTEISTFGHLHGAGGTAYTLHKIIHGHKDQNKQSLNITAMQEHKDETQKMDRDMSFQTHKEISHKASAVSVLCIFANPNVIWDHILHSLNKLKCLYSM